MLDEFTRLTGYTGSYAAFVLRPPLAHNSSWMHKYLWFFAGAGVRLSHHARIESAANHYEDRGGGQQDREIER
jgi:hypothetical protein